MDVEHHRLVDMVNQLEEAMRTGKGKEVMGGILNGLVHYAETHFKNEERLLSLHAYPSLAAQRSEHQALTTKVLEFEKQFSEGRVGLTIPMMNFLSDWLTKHILDSDMKYGVYLSAKGVR